MSTQHQGPAHLQVLVLSPAVGDRALRHVFHGKKHETADEAALAADRQHIGDSLDAALEKSAACAPATLSALPAIGQPLDGSELALLQAAHPADAYLRVQITDYGETPRRWEGAYITFEVVTTLAIAAGLYVHKVTRAVAGAYLVEETIEELSEGYAGFWALNRLSRPVRIEADLIDGRSGQVLWHHAHTGLARWRWHNLWHMDDATRDALLDASTHKAAAAFSRDLRAGFTCD